ncbi:(4Fe-4S)-binding protein [Candidatus Acetothermia bacterium]|nr:(4Fe-4S)-binding protein [Candidatus Acetothermia bacterium]MBI3459536.1 (4Fe-4S)-binding protein [Candidatus Acetothermia bacterium]
MAKQYRSDEIVVTFEPRLCIHSAHCIKGLPEVFDVLKKPWIQPDKAIADRIAEVVQRCPTGALHYQRLDGGAEESVPSAMTIEVRPKGPLFVRGSIVIKGSDGQVIRQDTRMALCRCGHSGNKPFCDGTHKSVQFDSASIPSGKEESR